MLGSGAGGASAAATATTVAAAANAHGNMVDELRGLHRKMQEEPCLCL